MCMYDVSVPQFLTLMHVYDAHIYFVLDRRTDEQGDFRSWIVIYYCNLSYFSKIIPEQHREVSPFQMRKRL